MKNTEVITKESLPINQYFSREVISAIIKTGIIKSNSLGMVAGLCLAIAVNDLSFVTQIPIIILALIGTSFVVGGAGAVNNFYDRDIDAIMKRTKDRPTVTGAVNPKFALWLGLALFVIGVGILFLVSNMAAIMGILGFFFYVVPYTML